MILDIQKKNKDIQFGLMKEDEILEDLNEFLSCELINTKELYGKYCPFDYEDKQKKVRIELKSRRIKHNEYPTGIFIGHNKIVKGQKNIDEGWEHYYFWNCIDGVYWVEHKKEYLNYKKQDVELRRGEIARNVIFIPLNHLHKIEYEEKE